MLPEQGQNRQDKTNKADQHKHARKKDRRDFILASYFGTYDGVGQGRDYCGVPYSG